MRTWIIRICAVLAFAATVVAVFLVSDHFAQKWETALVRDISLNGPDGNAWHIDDLGGKMGIIYFGYTYCPDVCPTALNTLAIALDDMGAARETFQPVFVSVDPDRDSPALIRDYVAQFDDAILGLTGPPAQIAEFARAFGATYVIRKKEGDTSDDYIVDHTANFFLATANGTRVPLPYTYDPDELRTNLLNAPTRLGR